MSTLAVKNPLEAAVFYNRFLSVEVKLAYGTQVLEVECNQEEKFYGFFNFAQNP